MSLLAIDAASVLLENQRDGRIIYLWFSVGSLRKINPSPLAMFLIFSGVSGVVLALSWVGFWSTCVG